LSEGENTLPPNVPLTFVSYPAKSSPVVDQITRLKTLLLFGDLQSTSGNDFRAHFSQLYSSKRDNHDFVIDNKDFLSCSSCFQCLQVSSRAMRCDKLGKIRPRLCLLARGRFSTEEISYLLFEFIKHDTFYQVAISLRQARVFPIAVVGSIDNDWQMRVFPLDIMQYLKAVVAIQT
jgi:hypothetical protein